MFGLFLGVFGFSSVKRLFLSQCFLARKSRYVYNKYIYKQDFNEYLLNKLFFMVSVFSFLVMQRKTGSPSDAELLNLSSELGSKWKNLARALGIPEANIEIIEDENRKVIEKCYKSLLLWKQGRGFQANYEVLEAGLCHGVVLRRDLAEKYCYCHGMPQEHDHAG